MRRLLILTSLSCLALAAPAAGQAVEPLLDDEIVEQEESALTRALPHPFEVEEAGDRLGRTLDAIMDVPVGDVVRSVDPASPLGPDARLGEVAGGGDPAYRDHVRDELSGLSLKLADAMRLMRARAPAVERSLRDLERSLTSALPRD